MEAHSAKIFAKGGILSFSGYAARQLIFKFL